MASAEQVLVRAVVETTSGTFVTPASTNAMLLLSDGFDSYNEQEQQKIGFLDGKLSPEVVIAGASFLKHSVVFGAIGGGVAGGAPQTDAYLLSAGLAKTVAAGRVEYTIAPAPGANKSLSFESYLAGLKYSGKGCMGTLDLSVQVNQVGKCSFGGLAMEQTAPVAAVIPADSFAGWRTPVPGSPTRSSRISLAASGGVTYSVGSISGGNTFLWSSYQLTGGQSVDKSPWCGGLGLDINKANPTVKITVLLTPAEAAAMEARYKAGTGISIGFSHNLSAAGAVVPGETIVVHHPNALITSLKNTGKFNGQFVAEIDAVPNPSSPGLTDGTRLVYL
jgi:hypothetical protein